MKNLKSNKVDPDTRLKVLEYMAPPGISQGVTGGMENHVLLLCELLNHDQIKVMLTCPLGEGGAELFDRARAMGVAVFGFPSSGRGKLDYLKRSFALWQLLRRERVDLLHIHACGFSGFNAYLAAIFARVGTVIVTHHSWFGPRPHNLSSRLSLWFERRIPRRVIMLHQAQALEVQEAGVPAERVVVAPMGVDLRKFEYRDDTVRPDPMLFRIVIASRLAEYKGHEELVEAVHMIAGRYPQLRVLMIGDGPTRPRVEALVKSLSLEGIIEMVGKVPNDQVPDLVRTAQAAVLPTYTPGEGLPNGLMEAMAMGLPVIGTRFGGIPDLIVDGETGLLVEPQDVNGLAAAIETLIKDPDLASSMGERALSRVRQYFSAENQGRKRTAICLEAAAESGWRGRRDRRDRMDDGQRATRSTV